MTGVAVEPPSAWSRTILTTKCPILLRRLRMEAAARARFAAVMKLLSDPSRQARSRKALHLQRKPLTASPAAALLVPESYSAMPRDGKLGQLSRGGASSARLSYALLRCASGRGRTRRVCRVRTGGPAARSRRVLPASTRLRLPVQQGTPHPEPSSRLSLAVRPVSEARPPAAA